ncbi:putative aaa family [Diaporthe ampelina]|uniref:Putative aaa family n=1 Tax=Diaporthe ampelina TaxID=1214573 RepID=A0A0G2F894_9PEZI|nr:putative aaa family [Diaporthe ampelina]
MADTNPKVAVYYSKGGPPSLLSLEELSVLMKTTDVNVEAEEAEEAEESSEGESSAADTPDEQEKETTSAPVGCVSQVKNIYKSSKDKDGVWTWVDKYPEDVAEPAENAVTDTYAVLVRNVKSQDGRKKLEAHSIVVQSPWLQKALGDVVLKDYPGVACELKRLTFEAPFKPFIHRWFELLAYMKRPDLDVTTKEHLVVLHDILQYEIGDSIKAYEDYVLNGVITFEHLWMIFQPGSIILAAHKGPLSAFELGEAQYLENKCGKFLGLSADCVDYSGKEFGRVTERIDVPEFIGTKNITGLNAFPLRFHENEEAVAASLVARGRIFEKLAGHHYKAYDGTAITWDQQGNEVPIQLSGRIVVDIHSFNRSNMWRRRRLTDWKAKDLERLHEHRRKHGLSGQDSLQLTPYYQMLARSRTRGYSLKRKEWLEFYVEQVDEIKWNRDAFEKLVLPDDQKELIMAFSESQLDGGDTFDDVISGKGRGIICLLSGPPGVGKTLTAEAVAESLRVPLHTLSSGDLGSRPWEVEQGLSQILELVARWNAILLLDECDVFLEARSTHDLERNKVVSIFLRTLEYYEGILFMTTNRVDNIDQAFQSRIHVSLEYPDLTARSRAHIWRNFLSAARQEPELTGQDVEELARLELNGRQIKNILKTAQLLAKRKKSVLRRSFIETVLAIEKRRPAVNDGAGWVEENGI